MNFGLTQSFAWILGFWIGFTGLGTPEAQAFFWQGQPELEKKIFKGNQILVSVTSHTRSSLKGVGVVQAKAKQVADFATDPEKLKANVQEIRELDWNPKEGPLKIKIKFLWLERQLEGTAKFRDKTDSQERTIDFMIDKGLWFTVKGVLEMRELEEHKTLVMIMAETLEGETFSWPVRVALEATLQRIAGTLRQKVQSEGAK